MKSKPIRILPIASLLILAILTACGNKIEPGTTTSDTGRTIKAPLAEARISQTPLVYEAVATINARTASTISAKLMGTVQSIRVQEGRRVHQGDLLVTLDQRAVTAQFKQAKAGLAEARRVEVSALSARDAAGAGADLASATYKRYKQLLKENSVSRQEFDEVQSRHRQANASLSQAQAMLDAARSRVQQAEAALQQANLARKDAQVRAPYDGRVVAKLINEGDLATPGTPLLTIEQEGLFCADLILPERYIQTVRIGLSVKVQVPALDNLEATGEVGRIIPAADVQSRSFEIKVAMPVGLDLKSGMFARVFVPIGGTGMLLIPETAVVNEGQLTGIFVVDQDGIARFRLVRTGRQYGDQVEIISGLQKGQRFVSAAPVQLKDGMKVEGI